MSHGANNSPHSFRSNSLVNRRVAARSSSELGGRRKAFAQLARARRRGRKSRPSLEGRSSRPYGQRGNASSNTVVFMEAHFVMPWFWSTSQTVRRATGERRAGRTSSRLRRHGSVSLRQCALPPRHRGEGVVDVVSRCPGWRRGRCPASRMERADVPTGRGDNRSPWHQRLTSSGRTSSLIRPFEVQQNHFVSGTGVFAFPDP